MDMGENQKVAFWVHLYYGFFMVCTGVEVWYRVLPHNSMAVAREGTTWGNQPAGLLYYLLRKQDTGRSFF
jgi:hypothetical protein